MVPTNVFETRMTRLCATSCSTSDVFGGFIADDCKGSREGEDGEDDEDEEAEDNEDSHSTSKAWSVSRVRAWTTRPLDSV